jgi:hypothetical protein
MSSFFFNMKISILEESNPYEAEQAQIQENHSHVPDRVGG